MAKWKHLHKGLIVGQVVKENEKFVEIKLENEVWGVTRKWFPGEVIPLRKSLLTLIEEDAEERTGG